jgi:hypothetical protein
VITTVLTLLTERVHAHVVQQGQVDLQHVQADEMWVKMVGRRAWTAIPSRLWLGGVISPRRDLALITSLVQMVRSRALSPAILVWSMAWPATSRPSFGSFATRCVPAVRVGLAWKKDLVC